MPTYDVIVSLASHARVGGKMCEEEGEGGRGRKRGEEEEAMGREKARESENGQGTERARDRVGRGRGKKERSCARESERAEKRDKEVRGGAGREETRGRVMEDDSQEGEETRGRVMTHKKVT